LQKNSDTLQHLMFEEVSCPQLCVYLEYHTKYLHVYYDLLTTDMTMIVRITKTLQNILIKVQRKSRSTI